MSWVSSSRALHLDALVAATLLVACLSGKTGSNSDTGAPGDSTQPQDSEAMDSAETGLPRDSSNPGDTAEADDTAWPDDTAEPSLADCSGGSGWSPGAWVTVIDGTSTLVVVPEDLPPCAPLLLHGHGGTAAGGFRDGTWDDSLGTDFQELASTWGFVLMVPGVEEGGGVTHVWNLGDTATLAAMVYEAWDKLDMDRNRAWFNGQSAGGHMACYTGLYDPGPMTGISVISAGLGKYFDYPEVEPAVKLPFYLGHDPDDTVVDYAYSENLASELEAHGHEYLFQDWDMGATGHGWNPDLSEAILSWLFSH